MLKEQPSDIRPERQAKGGGVHFGLLALGGGAAECVDHSAFPLLAAAALFLFRRIAHQKYPNSKYCSAGVKGAEPPLPGARGGTPAKRVGNAGSPKAARYYQHTACPSRTFRSFTSVSNRADSPHAPFVRGGRSDERRS